MPMTSNDLPLSSGFDPFGHSGLYPPYETFDRMRQETPVCCLPQYGLWLLTRYADVVEMLTDTRFSSSRKRSDDENCPPSLRSAAAEVEGFFARWLPLATAEDHSELRQTISALFAPDVLHTVQSSLNKKVTAIVDRAAAAGGMDVVSELAFPLARDVLARILGVPSKDIQTLKELTTGLTALSSLRAPNENSIRRSLHAVRSLTGYFRKQLRSSGCSQWPVSLEEVLEQQGYDRENSFALATVFIVGAYETVAYQLANSLLALLEAHAFPYLRESPGLLDSAVEESIRYDAVTRSVMRRTLEDVEVHGVLIPKNSFVAASVHSANRDPAQFPEPHRLWLDRAPNRHLGYGFGARACVGAKLARLQLTTAIRILLDRMPNLRLTGRTLERIPNPMFHGLHALSVAT